GRQVQIAVRGPRIAVDAAVFAASVRVDRLVEGDVGRGVARQDAARLLEGHGGGHLGPRGPIVRECGPVGFALKGRLALPSMETVRHLGHRAPPLLRGAAHPVIRDGIKLAWHTVFSYSIWKLQALPSFKAA